MALKLLGNDGTVQTVAPGTTLKILGNDGTLQEVTFGAVVTPGATSVLVAANDASALVRSRADFLCDGTNDEAQIRAAIDALPADGGNVELSEGTFILSKVGVAANPPEGYCLLIDQNDGAVKLSGQGEATAIQLAPNQDADTSIILVRGDNGDKRTSPTWIQNLKIDGNKPNQVNAWLDYADLEIAYADDVTVFGCFFTEPNKMSVRAFRDSQRVTIDLGVFDVNDETGIRTESEGYVITRCYLRADPSEGLLLDLATNADIDVESEAIIVAHNTLDGALNQFSGSGLKRCVIANNVLKNATNNSSVSMKIQHYDAATDYGAEHNIITGNLFYNIRQGIQLSSGANANLYNRFNYVIDNLIIDGPDVNLAFGIRETGTNINNNVIERNYLEGAATVITKVGANTRVRNNKGYTTENSGTGTIASGTTSIAVNHGLSVTPTIDDIMITLAEQATNDPGEIWVDTIGAAQFTVNCRNDPGVSNLDFGWHIQVL